VQEAIDAGIVEICIVIHKSKEEIRRYFESDNREAGEAERPAETLQSRCIVFILGSCVLGLGQRWLLRGSFAIAIVAIAIALGAPTPDQWAQLLQDARRTLFASG